VSIKSIRNLAIVAHVDHGKTTLVDKLLERCNTIAPGKLSERFMDSGDLEQERGITITSKHVSLEFQGHKINLIDTPGHADFGGEVERVLCLADGVLLLVDAQEGPMPQTRFVLKKAMEHKLKPLVIINKIDRPHHRALEVQDEILELFIDLDAPEAFLDFPVLYASGRDGIVQREPDSKNEGMDLLFEFILKNLEPSELINDKPGAIRITTTEADEFMGKIGIGRVHLGKVSKNDKVWVLNQDSTEMKQQVIKGLFSYKGLERVAIDSAPSGELVAVTGITDVQIGQTLTLCDPPKCLAPVPIDEPTLSMEFLVNNSPFAGQEGSYVTSSKLGERLKKELEGNVSLRIEATDSPDRFTVAGRGLLHLSILIEKMRREGYELGVSRPKVLTKIIDGKVHEPFLQTFIEVKEEYSSKVIDSLLKGGGKLKGMTSRHSTCFLEFSCPARSMIGMRTKLLTLCRGEVTLSTLFEGFFQAKVDPRVRENGALVSMLEGTCAAYALDSIQNRGILFAVPGDKVYEGMVIGENSRGGDLAINPVKGKKHSNVRAAGTDRNTQLSPPRILSMEDAIEFLAEDEILEVTPKAFRIRKTILNADERKKAGKGVNLTF
jgi:GTP-binding protein